LKPVMSMVVTAHRQRSQRLSGGWHDAGAIEA